MKIVNQLKIATQPAISKVVVDWGQLGALPPPSYEQLTSGGAEIDASTAAAATVVDAPKSPRNGLCRFARSCFCKGMTFVFVAPVDVGGDATLTTFVVECADTVPGEELALIGSLPALGFEILSLLSLVVF